MNSSFRLGVGDDALVLVETPATPERSATRLPPARGAAPVELDPMVRDAESTPGRDARAECTRMRLGERTVHVHDAPAEKAREVMVVARVAVEARVGSGQLLDEPFGDQEPQVAVHGAEAHTREPAPHHPVD